MKHSNKLSQFIAFMAIASFSIFISSCSNSKKETDCSAYGLNGKVKSIREVSYEAVERSGNIDKGDRKREDQLQHDTYIVFDQQGNEIETNWHNLDGSLFRKHIYTYDDKDNMIEANEYISDACLDMKLTYAYDDKGNNIEVNGYNFNDSLLW